MKYAFRFDVERFVNGYKLPTRLKKELTTLCNGNLSKVLSRTRVSPRGASFKTQERRMYTVCRSFEELRELGFKLETPHALASKHIQALVDHWVADQQMGSTLENKLTNLRAFCSWMGKRGLVLTLGAYVDREAAGVVRKYTTTDDKSWIGADIDCQQVIAEIEREHPRVAIQLKLQAAFGLRLEESFSFKPSRAFLNAEMLRITDGTKGGRARLVPIQLRLDVLEEAVALVDPITGSTTPVGYSIARWRSHYNWVMQKFGVTRKGMGVTSHGLRHQWLQQYYEVQTGVPAPVKGSAERAAIEAHRQALRATVEAAGHSRTSKTGAYLSTYQAMAGKGKSPIAPDAAREALDLAEGNVSRAAKALGITRQSLYRALARTTKGA